jgi:hypothetical protein
MFLLLKGTAVKMIGSDGSPITAANSHGLT